MNSYFAAAQQLPPLLDRYGGPVGVLGKLVGLGQEEVEAGVPWWGWLGVGVFAGGIIAYSLRNKIEQIVEA